MQYPDYEAPTLDTQSRTIISTLPRLLAQLKNEIRTYKRPNPINRSVLDNLEQDIQAMETSVANLRGEVSTSSLTPSVSVTSQESEFITW